MSSTTAAALAPEAPMDPSSSDPADDTTYIMNTFSTLLEGDLYDDELNGKFTNC